MLIAGVTCWVILVEARLLPQKWPAANRQVPSAVIGRGSVLGPAQFGFEMGTGARTFMPTPLPFIALTAATILFGFAPALITGLAFGLGRAAMTTARYYSRRPAIWDARLDKHLRAIRWLMVIVASSMAFVVAV